MISFVYPGFLWALTAVAIPIIIHLFNFRKFKRIYFSNVALLEEVQIQSKSRNRLRQLLILAARILAIVALVLAFAQPFIPGTNTVQGLGGRRFISVYVDNSFSMDAVDKGGRLLEVAKIQARDIASAYEQGDMFQLLTNDFEARHQRFYSKDEFLKLVDEVQSSAVSRPLQDVMIRQKDAFSRESGGVFRGYLISDFQKSMLDFQTIKPDSSALFQMVQLVPQQTGNLFIDSCWLVSPEVQIQQPIRFGMKLVNKSAQSFENLPIKIFINNEQRAPSVVSLAPGETKELEIQFTVNTFGWHSGYIRIEDQDITFDDQSYFSFYVPEQLQILNVKGREAQSYVEKLFGDDPYFKLVSVSGEQLAYNTLPSYDLIILNELAAYSTGLAEELKKFTAQGGAILAIPAANADLNSYNALFNTLKVNQYMRLDTARTAVGRIVSDASFFADVFEAIPENMDLPYVANHYQISNSSQIAGEKILTLRNGAPFLSVDQSSNGKVYQLAVSLTDKFGNFGRHALFVPTLLKTAFTAQYQQPIYFTVGEEAMAIVKETVDADGVMGLRLLGEKDVLIPEQRSMGTITQLFLGAGITKAGIYEVVYRNRVVSQIALNYNRLESDPTCWNTEELTQNLASSGITNMQVLASQNTDLPQYIKSAELGTPLWKLFIIFVLIFLAIEILLIRVLKG